MALQLFKRFSRMEHLDQRPGKRIIGGINHCGREEEEEDADIFQYEFLGCERRDIYMFDMMRI